MKERDLLTSSWVPNVKQQSEIFSEGAFLLFLQNKSDSEYKVSSNGSLFIGYSLSQRSVWKGKNEKLIV